MTTIWKYGKLVQSSWYNSSYHVLLMEYISNTLLLCTLDPEFMHFGIKMGFDVDSFDRINDDYHIHKWFH